MGRILSLFAPRASATEQAANDNVKLPKINSEKDLRAFYADTRAKMADLNRRVLTSQVEKTPSSDLEEMYKEGMEIRLKLNHALSLLEEENPKINFRNSLKKEMRKQISQLIEKREKADQALSLHIIMTRQQEIINKSDPLKIITFMVAMPLGFGGIGKLFWDNNPDAIGCGTGLGAAIGIWAGIGKNIVSVFKKTGTAVCKPAIHIEKMVKTSFNILKKDMMEISKIRNSFMIYYAKELTLNKASKILNPLPTQKNGINRNRGESHHL